VAAIQASWTLARRPARRATATISANAEATASSAIVRLGELPVDRVAVAFLHQEVWALRHALSVYDAAYVAVAQRLGCALLTLDRRLAAGAPGGVPVTVL